MAAAPSPDRPKTRDLRQLARLAAFAAPHKWRIAAALAALVVAAGAVLALGQGLKSVIDSGFGSRNPHELDTALVAFVAIAFVMAVASYLRFFLMMTTGERVITDIRSAVFGHVLRQPPAFFESRQTGEIVSRLTNDVTLIESVIGWGLSMFLRNLLMMAGATALLVVTSPKLAALTLLGTSVALTPALFLGRRVRRLARTSQDRIADVAAYIDEALHEVRTVQAYVHEAEDRRRFGERAEAAFDTAVARIRHRGVLFASVLLTAFCGIGFILWIGGHDVFAGRISAGQLSAFVFYAAIVGSGAGALSEVWGDLQRAAGATERLMELLAETPAIESPPAPQPLPRPPRGEVGLAHVTFAYPSRRDAPALTDFTLPVAPGEKVALVGPSGAGKTTVFQLLLRFYDPDAGVVLVDGLDARRADLAELRRRFALVPQEPVIFGASVAENVRYARPEASDADVHAAWIWTHPGGACERRAHVRRVPPPHPARPDARARPAAPRDARRSGSGDLGLGRGEPALRARAGQVQRLAGWARDRRRAPPARGARAARPVPRRAPPQAGAGPVALTARLRIPPHPLRHRVCDPARRSLVSPASSPSGVPHAPAP